MVSIGELERELEEAEREWSRFLFAEMTHEGELSEKFEEDKEKAEERVHEIHEKLQGEISGFEEFKEISDSPTGKTNYDIYEAFLEVPKKWRKYAMEQCFWKMYLDLAESEEHEFPEDKTDEQFLEIAETLDELRKRRADTIDDLHKPTPSEALKILKRMKEEKGWSWKTVKTNYILIPEAKKRVSGETN